MKKTIFFYVILLTVVPIWSQSKSIFFEPVVFSADSLGHNCYLTFKIPYKNLVFVKDNGSYTGGADIFYEIRQCEDVKKRITSSGSVVTYDYEMTKSSTEFLEGIVSFHMYPGSYEVFPSINLENTKREILLDRYTFRLEVDSSDQKVIPLIAYQGTVKCNGSSGKQLVNMNKTIPFDANRYDLLISVSDETVKTINVEVLQNSELIRKHELNDFLMGESFLKDCGGKIIYTLRKGTNRIKTYLLNDVNKDLVEGPVRINVLSGADTLYSENINVLWNNRPMILNDVELSSSLFTKVTKDEQIDSIFEAPSEEYYANLFKYWKKLDPVKSTTFNELMAEFYERADISRERFKTADNFDGSRTDRGIVFIKYGEPDDINRSYKKKNNIIEIWKYVKLDREFIFEDSDGLGNYHLVE